MKQYPNVTDFVQFYNCSRCGCDWTVKVGLPFWTRERIIEIRKDLDNFFGDHHCNRCTTRDILISLATNAGKAADDETIEKKTPRTWLVKRE